VRRELGVDLEDLTGPRRRAQAFAGRIAELGAEAAIVPSAARPGAWNLVVLPTGFARLSVAGSRATQPRA
jgi:hypothetical protein